MHVDLFRSGHSPDEVYQALAAHQVRDQRTIAVLDGIVCLALIGALTNFHGWAVELWVVVAVAGFSALRYFVDMSNRNFFMHRLDWEGAANSGNSRV